MNIHIGMIKEICQLTSQLNIPLYGGGVRDWLLGELPKDLDFLLEPADVPNKITTFEIGLIAAKYHIDSSYQTKYGFGLSRRLTVRKMTIPEEHRIPIRIDLTINQPSDCYCQESKEYPTHGCHCIPGSRRFDMDCNQLICRFDQTHNMVGLTFHPRFTKFLRENSQISLSFVKKEVFERILNREFLIIHTKCSSIKYLEGYKLKIRINSMIQRGWKCLNPQVCQDSDCYANLSVQLESQ